MENGTFGVDDCLGFQTHLVWDCGCCTTTAILVGFGKTFVVVGGLVVEESDKDPSIESTETMRE